MYAYLCIIVLAQLLAHEKGQACDAIGKSQLCTTVANAGLLSGASGLPVATMRACHLQKVVRANHESWLLPATRVAAWA